jgi:hypothetical protein
VWPVLERESAEGGRRLEDDQADWDAAAVSGYKKLPLDPDIAECETPYDEAMVPSAYMGRPPVRRKGGNRAMQSVFRQGRQAARNGLALRDCPYWRGEQFTGRGGVTFSRAFIRTWSDGWHVEKIGDRNACRLWPIHDGDCEAK